jgi:Flp pilus assembly protein TadD
MDRERRLQVLAAAVLVLGAVVCYLPAMDGSWLVDDENYLVDNANLRTGAGLLRIWTDPHASTQYYPLVFTSFWLEHRIWGLDTRGYHLVSVLLHALNSLLVWRILRRLGLPGAWVAAAVFAAHPLHVESVAWITERKNTLSTAAYLLSALAYLRWDAAGGRRWYVAALVAFLAALLAKTSAATLPAALLLVIWWRRGRLTGGDVRATLPLFALGLVLGLFTVWLERTHVGAVGGIFDLSVAQRVLVAGRACWHYAAKIVWPVGLVFDYGRWHPDPGDLAAWAGPLAAVLAVAVLWAGRGRWGRGPLVGVLYFMGTVLPALGFINLFYFRYAYVADHFVYPASLGLIALSVGAVGAALRRVRVRPRLVPAVLAGVVLVLLAAGSWRRAGAFVSMEALCRDILARTPTSWLGHNNLGDALMKRGELEGARDHLETAARIAPDRLETQLNLAILCMNTDRHDDALVHARRAVALAPDAVQGHLVLGEAHLRGADPVRAVSAFEQALARDPTSLRALAGLGAALARSERYAEAVAHLVKAVAADPTRVAARTDLAICLANLGEYDGALHQLEAALALQPDNPAIRQNLQLVRERAAHADGD